MSPRRSAGSETDEVINHRTGKGYVPVANRPEMKLKSGTVEDKTVGARPVPSCRPAQHSSPARGPRGIGQLVPPPSIRYRQPIVAPAVPSCRPAQHSSPARGPRGIAQLVPPPSIRYRQPIVAPAVPSCRPAQHSVPARGPRGIGQLVPPPSIRYRQPIVAPAVPSCRPAQHSAPARGPRGIAILVPPPSIRYRQPIVAPAVPSCRPAQHSVPARGPRGIAQLVPPPSIQYRQPIMAPPVPLYLKSGMKRDYSPPPEETPMEILPEDQEIISPYPDDDRFMLLTRLPKTINGRWIEYPPILIPKADRIHECILEEEPPWADIVSEPCDICGGKYGKHDCTACPLRDRCLLDEEVGKDFEVVCLFHAIPNCPRRCSGNFGRAAFKITDAFKIPLT
ncbi:hypothetical protein CASFOL_011295 [Castilleja foliolosa]|uniref:Uncharacterized protein n=1 Tax=Castilleja foliolosa TaxID=1961234 RepID=A0ABD3DV40_9LAMI